ncbi:MAG TPA: hypothetical protein VGU74_06610 [Gemmatimonadales bacterium]|nr:hypothetical protein [Gemmatimonadales bacterium]
MSAPTLKGVVRILPSLSGAVWPDHAYRRHELPERVLQFGTGMLLRALCAASVDAANRAGRSAGRIVVVQSAPQGKAPELNAQDGLFTLAERGLENGAQIERTKMRIRVVPLIGSFTQRRGRAPHRLALACAAHLLVLRAPLETLAEASRLPDFVGAVDRWKCEIERDGVEGALGAAHD